MKKAFTFTVKVKLSKIETVKVLLDYGNGYYFWRIEQLANFKELADHIKKEYPKKRKRRLEFERALGCVIG